MRLLTNINGFCSQCKNSHICKYRQSATRAIESLNALQDKFESDIDVIANTNKVYLTIQQADEEILQGNTRSIITVECKYFVGEVSPAAEPSE